MPSFRAFLEAIDTPGGHLLLLVCACLSGAAMSALKIEMDKGIVHDAFVALLTILSTRRMLQNVNSTGGGEVKVTTTGKDDKLGA